MRPRISWADLRGARVGVWGLGVEGSANVRALRALGVEPVLVDDNVSSHDGGAVLRTAAGGLDALLACEVVVKTPGISRSRAEARALVDAGVVLAGGLGLWMAGAPLDRVVAITGTKGKSTTTSITAHLLERLGRRVFVGGNIGRPPYDPGAPTDVDVWVVEVSSYQATDLPCSPATVAVTSLHPDHLDWHGDVERYYADKLSACSQPGARLTVANGDSDELRSRQGLLGPTVDWVTLAGAEALDWHRPLGLRGRHNVRNAEIARHCLLGLGVDAAADLDRMRVAAAGYAGLEHRLQTIAEADGVEFVDDVLSTNVLPTLAAVDAFAGRRTALVVGGFDRGIDYTALADGLSARSAPLLVVTMAGAPGAGTRIDEALRAAALPPCVELGVASSLDEAVERGFAWARPDGVVLLSPAAPSFGTYRDYHERAAAFASAVARCVAAG